MKTAERLVCSLAIYFVNQKIEIQCSSIAMLHQMPPTYLCIQTSFAEFSQGNNMCIIGFLFYGIYPITYTFPSNLLQAAHCKVYKRSNLLPNKQIQITLR
jgi:hypothetical protein